jgi:ABC-type cobalamin/Fe3+-siderophores transport system ATPase subunit
MEELADLHRRGNTILMVTHNPNLTSYASRVINMLDGRVASDKKIRVTAVPDEQKIILRTPKKTKAEKKPAKTNDLIKPAPKKSAKKTKKKKVKKS